MLGIQSGGLDRVRFLCTIDRISSWRKMHIGAEVPYIHSRYIKEKTLCKADGGQVGLDTQDSGSRNSSLFSGVVFLSL